MDFTDPPAAPAATALPPLPRRLPATGGDEPAERVPEQRPATPDSADRAAALTAVAAELDRTPRTDAVLALRPAADRAGADLHRLRLPAIRRTATAAEYARTVRGLARRHVDQLADAAALADAMGDPEAAHLLRRQVRDLVLGGAA